MEMIKATSHEFFEESVLALKDLLVKEAKTESEKQDRSSRIKEARSRSGQKELSCGRRALATNTPTSNQRTRSVIDKLLPI